MVIEGLDGAGTTTQVHLLDRRLSQSSGVYVTHEPSEGPVGSLIRLVLEHRVKVSDATLAALFAADLMDHRYCREGNGGIVAQLAQGFHVLTDRYYLSSLAYQGISLDWQWIWDMHAHCVRPDATVFVDVPVDVCLQRITSGRGRHFDLFENKRVLTHARQSYLRAIERLHRAGVQVEVIEGDAPPNQVHAAIWEHVKVLF